MRSTSSAKRTDVLICERNLERNWLQKRRTPPYKRGEALALACGEAGLGGSHSDGLGTSDLEYGRQLYE